MNAPLEFQPVRGAISRRMTARFAFTVAALLLGAGAATAQATAAKQEKPGPLAAMAGGSPQAAVEIPRSEFRMPTSPTEGKDPFFPSSTRVYGEKKVVIPQTTTPAPPPPVDLVLNGFSGTADKPLAIINQANFGVGDSLEVVSGKDRVRVLCLEINVQAGTAVVEANGVRRILRFARSN